MQRLHRSEPPSRGRSGQGLPCCPVPEDGDDEPWELRALHTDETLYFLAQWSGEPPSGNVFETLFAQVWNGANYVKRRAALYTTQPLHPRELCGHNWSL
jgi:hypothetical protein